MAGEKRTDWWRLAKLFVTFVLSCYVGLRFQPMVANNPNAVNTVVTILSILAGFLIAVMTLVIEPILRQSKGWADLQLMKKTVQGKLFRQKLLFFLYLLTLGVVLTMYLIPPALTEVLRWLQTTFLGLATFVFLASFSVPGALMKIQMERYQAALEDLQPRVVTEVKKKEAEKARKRPD